MSRDQLLSQWLQQQYPDAVPDCVPASSDASFRRFFRLTFADGNTQILMDAPPDKENSRAFVQVANLLHAANIPAPQVFVSDFEQGFFVLSDLGRLIYLEVLKAEPQHADAFMRPVLDTLVCWQKASRAAVLPPYDATLLQREMALFPEWFLGRHLSITLTEPEQRDLRQVFAFLTNSALNQPKVFVHRDFMPRNLMLLEGGDSIVPAVIDFQDAVYGPITYDVVSLFRDAFISWDEEQEIDWVVRYWEKARAAGLPVRADFGRFWREYELMGLQRHLKVLGIFCRLNYRDGKTHYLADLPRFIHYALKTARRYHELKSLAKLLERIAGDSEQSRSGFTF